MIRETSKMQLELPIRNGQRGRSWVRRLVGGNESLRQKRGDLVLRDS